MKAIAGDGKDLIKVNSEDYEGKWLVFLFYLLDFTFIFPTETTGYSRRI